MSDTTFGTYDPATRPGRRSTAPEGGSGLRDEDGSELPQFDSRYVQPFKGLLYLGALTDTFTWMGHEFVVRTLAPDEQLAISLVTKPYIGTSGEQLAYMVAVVAMATVSVDGEELPSPVAEDARIGEWAHRRFSYVKESWYQYTIAEVFQRYLHLEDTAAKVVEAMGKAFAPTDSTPGSNGTSA